MRLGKIVLDGFKSFADRTELSFEHPITAIVGPNGCGKSNVVDAVKWVLGEQSVKSLRSGQMSDVIFGGSTSRKPTASAEVSLFFSNTSGTLAIESDDVQVTRRIYRSGESEYLINNKICRLRDIKELFMDTGVGAKAYSIIEQGQIAQLLQASKIDRRAIFEEAAGISKYKAHKKEALRKLERTEQNLLRLVDILSEVDKQLRSVKHQAGKARSYLKYTERLKELQVNYSLVEYAKNHKAATEKTDVLGQVQKEFARIAAEVAKADALISSLGQQIVETENQVNRTDNALVSIQSKIEQGLQRMEFLRARTEELSQRKQNADERVEKLRQSKELFVRDLARYRQDQSRCHQQLAENEAMLTQVQKEIRRGITECASVEAELEDEKSGIIDIVRRTAQLHNELQSLSDYRDNLSSQRQRLSGRADTAKQELEQVVTEKAQYQVRLGDIEKNLNELQQSLELQQNKSEKVSKLIDADRDRLSRAKETLSALNGELGVLTDMENNREGLGSAVKEILRRCDCGQGEFNYIEGILADVICADVKYAAAVEASLEGKAASVIVNSTERLLSDIEQIEQLGGRVGFISLEKVKPFVDTTDLSAHSGVAGRLVEFVSYEGKYAPLVWQLLGGTLVVETFDVAFKLAKEFGGQYQFVTRRGGLLAKDGTIRLGPVGRGEGLISRKSRLRQLQEIIANMTTEITALQEQIQTNNQTKEHLARLCKDLRTAIYEANTEKTEISSTLAAYEKNIKRLSEEQPLIAGEIEMLEEQIAESVKREYSSKQQLDELDAVNKQRNSRIKELEEQFAQKKELLQEQNNKLTELKVRLGQIEEQSKALKRTIQSLQGQMASNDVAEHGAADEIQMCTEQIEQAQHDLLTSESVVSQLYIEKENTQQSSKEFHEQIEQLLEQQKEAEELVRVKRTEQTQVDERISELKVELAQVEVKQQDLVERVKEELQIDLADAFESYQEREVDWERVREEILDLRGKIERLGNVNLDAIEEQENLQKRQEFLGSQVQDLKSSKAQLQHLIGRLNKKSREKFEQTFEQIRTNFQQIFRRLFGGGRADIYLEEADDILEAAIEIIAKPPGKETRSISLLSGGEKSLTAIALLFAVFKTKPSPFCFLDEVDAALDEANNERFNLMIRQFQKDSQFIIITHAKRTMSIADLLYGITMQTKGVSKKISVQFDQYEPEEEMAAVA